MSLVFRKKDNLIFKEIENEGIIISMDQQSTDEDSVIYSINSTCVDVWNNIDGTKNLDSIILK